MNMNRLTKQCLAFLLGIIAFLFLCGLIGRQDYADQIIYTMSQETYDHITAKLGEGASSWDIANEYQDNRQYYDNLYK